MYRTMSVEAAADQYAHDEGQAEARAEFVDRFVTDAADECLCEEGNAAYLVADFPELETLFLRLLWSDPENAFHRVCELRDALRETAIKRWASEVNLRAIKLADEFIAEAA